MPSEISIFMSNGENKVTLLNLMEQVYVEDNTKWQDRVMHFSNKTHSRKISADDAYYWDTFFSDHEEADTKLVAYECSNNKKLLLRSLSGDIDIIILFMLHCPGNTFLDTWYGKARKIIDISCPMLSLCYCPLLKLNIKGDQEYMLFLVTIIFQVFFGKTRKSSGKY